MEKKWALEERVVREVRGLLGRSVLRHIEVSRTGARAEYNAITSLKTPPLLRLSEKRDTKKRY